jgi:hypothetical protein
MTEIDSKPIDKIKSIYYAYKLIYSIEDWLEEAPGRSVKIRHTNYNKSDLSGYPDYMQVVNPTKEFHNLHILHLDKDRRGIAEFTNDFDAVFYDIPVELFTNANCWHVGECKGDLVFTYNIEQSNKNYSSVDCLYIRFVDSFTGSIPKFVEELINL